MVTPALRAPLMAVTNAISSVIIVGAALVASLGLRVWRSFSVNMYSAGYRAHAGDVQEEKGKNAE